MALSEYLLTIGCYRNITENMWAGGIPTPCLLPYPKHCNFLCRAEAFNGHVHKKKVVVIGSGWAGLGAAHHLSKQVHSSLYLSLSIHPSIHPYISIYLSDYVTVRFSAFCICVCEIHFSLLSSGSPNENPVIVFGYFMVFYVENEMGFL